jgi:Phytanoyl-CoA dioxygenase (PhyH)
MTQSIDPQTMWAHLAPIYARRRAAAEQAMAQLGIGRPTQEMAGELGSTGYVFLPRLVGEDDCRQLADQIERIAKGEGDAAAAGGHIENGAIRVTGLLGRGEAFDRFVFDPRVLATVSHLLESDVQLSTLTARAPEKDGGSQSLHRDWHVAAPDGRAQAVNVIWALDPFTPENGATELVPGTHRAGEDPGTSQSENQQLVSAQMPAGSALVYSGHLWHRGTNNASGARRMAIHAFFTRTCYPQIDKLADSLTDETKARFTEAQSVILNIR